ncbi:Uma2 family endonuclease [[Phormidium] sp. ETS-05]|uniref:Uma2 family endonuclease n=1 Tax=[Phormidium] sp. ETS-05 TaxID=222819 RepID=UPI0018EED81C|nr:Uma2 family endonuclease [[Phormidium] sp. ETS-05]
MTAILSIQETTEIFYPSGDGEPMAETYDHVYAIMATLEVLKQYLTGRQATVLGNQFLYYSQGFPKLRVAPDVMVIFDVAPGGRDNYKIWAEGQVPAVIFEMTSPGTEDNDKSFKKTLYAQLGVKEYWLFDPKGEWIPEKLRGYRLMWEEIYEPITDGRSEPLQLRLAVEDKLISFYREDTGEKLLLPDELATALDEKTAQLSQEMQARQEAEAQAEAERQRREEMEAMLARYREQFGELPE